MRNLSQDICSDRKCILGPREYTSQTLPLVKKRRKNEERVIPSFPKIIIFYVRFHDSAAVWLKSSLFWDVTRRRLVVSDISGQHVLPVFKAQAVWDPRPLKMGVIYCTATSVTNCQPTPPNVPGNSKLQDFVPWWHFIPRCYTPPHQSERNLRHKFVVSKLGAQPPYAVSCLRTDRVKLLLNIALRPK